MNNIFIILLMVFCHTVADYNLQGWLASAKRYEWWKDNAPAKLYRFDFICALIVHSFIWTFVMMFPVAYKMNFSVNGMFMLLFVLNVLIHAIVDDLKANRHVINLCVDQAAHFIQIFITALILL